MVFRFDKCELVGKAECGKKKDCGFPNSSDFQLMSLFKAALQAALGSTSAVTLSEQTGISRSRLSEFINGKSLPKDDSLKELCEAFPANVKATLASAWIRERLGDEIADMILASETLTGTPLERVYTALPTPTQKAFYDLMTAARDDNDLRASLESLAAYSRPDDDDGEVKQTKWQGGGSGGNILRIVAEEHEKDNEP